MFESHRGIDVCLVSVVCCQVEISRTDPALDHTDPTEHGVSECNRGKPDRRPKVTKAIDP